jgi:membrane associated rhomboid family serine protease
MPQENPLKSTAITLGVLALLAIGAGLVIILLADPDSGSTGGGVLIRVGAVLGALALLLPSIRKPSLSTMLIAGAGLVLVLARPSLVWVALIGWSVWLIPRSQRSTAHKES